MKKITKMLWLPEDIHEQFKAKCKKESVTAQRKYIELVKEWVKEDTK